MKQIISIILSRKYNYEALQENEQSENGAFLKRFIIKNNFQT